MSAFLLAQIFQNFLFIFEKAFWNQSLKFSLYKVTFEDTYLVWTDYITTLNQIMRDWIVTTTHIKENTYSSFLRCATLFGVSCSNDVDMFRNFSLHQQHICLLNLLCPRVRQSEVDVITHVCTTHQYNRVITRNCELEYQGLPCAFCIVFEDEVSVNVFLLQISDVRFTFRVFPNLSQKDCVCSHFCTGYCLVCALSRLGLAINLLYHRTSMKCYQLAKFHL